MKKFITLTILLCSLKGIAQINEFIPFNSSQLPTPFLWNNVVWPEMNLQSDPQNPSTNDKTLRKMMILNEGFASAQIENLPTTSELRENVMEKKKLNGITSISIAEIQYSYFDTIGIQNGLISATPSGILYSGNINPVLSETTLLMHLNLSRFDETTIHFRLDSENFYSTYEDAPDEIRIDFDDGYGFRSIQMNITIDITYSSGLDDRLITAEVVRGDNISQSTNILKKIDCQSSFPSPDVLSPFPTDQGDNLPWQISTITTDNRYVCGNAYTLTSGAFDKPFIFVEGIDFNLDRTKKQNGEFGWCQFTSGINEVGYDYSMIHRMPVFLNH
jgi:hypothetical protein